MECEICKFEWDFELRIPRILNCGHNFCENCLKNLVKNNKIKCPKCENIIIINSINDINKLKKNISLLKIFDKFETKKKSLNENLNENKSLLSFSINDSNFLNSINEEISNEINNNYYPLCLIHKNKSYFYNIKNNIKTFFCEECLKEKNLENSIPIENLQKQNFIKINSCFEKIKIIQNEILKIENFFNNYQKNFREKNLNKIDELFNYIKKIIQFNYTIALTLFNQCKNEQKNQIEKKLNELKKLKNELKNFEFDLEKLNNLNNNFFHNFKPSNQLNLNNIFSKLSNFLNYENEINLFQMKIELNENSKEKLFNFIQNSYEIDIDFLKMKNGEIPTIKELLNKNLFWQCKCGFNENKNGNFICQKCSRYRQLENYNNIIFNSLKITNDELKELNSRRKHEIKVFQTLINKNDINNNFYAIDKNWFLEWKCFVKNDLSEKYIKNSNKKISDNKLIGVLPPGVLYNGNICDNINNKYVVKKNLKLNQDFIVVNSFLWEWFKLNYKCEPEILIENYNNKNNTNNENNNENINKNNNNKENKENLNINNIYYDETVKKNEFSPEKKQKKNDYNASTILIDTNNKINPIQNYKFNTKLSDFNTNNDNNNNKIENENEKEKKSLHIKSLIANIIINET